MSGIVGIINLDGSPVDRLLLARMTDYLAFRGPDAQETWSQGPVGLGHTLLRTVDDTRADSQPLTLDGQVWIVADARVDGRGELRPKLLGHGCRDLEEATDAELILQSYLVWGEECVRHLIGDFAFAIWDEPRRRLFAARDHFGVKPFYYARVGNCLVFSNTLNCLRMHPEVSDELNDLAIADFLLFTFNQDPATTTFADIHRLPPAHFFILKEGVLTTRRYWTFPVQEPLGYKRQSDYVDHFQELLREAVTDRLRTLQVGVFMSGGLDSTIVAATAKCLMAAHGSPFELQAYNVVYTQLFLDKDRQYSDLMAKHLGIPLCQLQADGYKLYERWEQEKIRGPEPQHRPLIANWIDLIAQASRQHRVVLTGEGGDVLLLPSQSYIHKMFKEMKWGWLVAEGGRCILKTGHLPPLGFRNFLQRLFGRENVYAYPEWLNQDFVARLDLQARFRQFKQETGPSHPLRPEVCRCLLGRYWQDYFEKLYDPGGNGLPVDFRHPFFDVRLVTFALRLPPIPWCVDKLLLREVSRGLLPEPVRRRPKKNLVVPPEVMILRKTDGQLMEHLIPAPGLSRYIGKLVIRSPGQEKCPQKIIDTLRLISLNYWLSGVKEEKKNTVNQPGH